MKLYSGPLSLFSRKVEIALGEKGLAFEREMVPFSQEKGYAPKHEAVLAANPKGQVPVLVDGDLTLYDSTVIFEYLEDAYPTPPLYPRAPKARARCRQLELFADEVLWQPVSRLMYRTEPPAADPLRRAEQETAAGEAEAAIAGHCDRLARMLGEQAFFCGELTVADIALFMTMLWSRRLKGPGWETHPSLARWHERLMARPGVAKAAAEIAAADRGLSPPL
ncbi:MAG TPA: glutathione S-transferase family protein [Acetobacteraceae bacterium]|nr:glutathione S-transferase family protein [Acetobacteraceae bacterium]